MPPLDPTPAVAYAAATPLPDPSHASPPSRPSLSTSPDRAARLQRMDSVLARLEIMLDDFSRRLAAQVLPPELFLDRFERATQALWRLTAVHKSLETLSANPLATVPPSLATDVDQIISDLRSADPGSADAPVRSSSPSTQVADLDSVRASSPSTQAASPETASLTSAPDTSSDTSSDPSSDPSQISNPGYALDSSRYKI